jgi:transcriptional regulator with XRE-family HTH domain
MSFSRLIKDKRYEKQLSQEALSQKIGCTRAMISYFENGKLIPSYPLLLKLIEALEDKGELLEAYNQAIQKKEDDNGK